MLLVGKPLGPVVTGKSRILCSPEDLMGRYIDKTWPYCPQYWDWTMAAPPGPPFFYYPDVTG